MLSLIPHPLKRHLDKLGLRFLVGGSVDISIAGRHNCGVDTLGLPSEVSEGIRDITSMINSYCMYWYLFLFC